MTKPISQTRNVGIYIFDEAEVLDLGGPFEVFLLADFASAYDFRSVGCFRHFVFA